MKKAETCFRKLLADRDERNARQILPVISQRRQTYQMRIGKPPVAAAFYR